MRVPRCTPRVIMAGLLDGVVGEKRLHGQWRKADRLEVYSHWALGGGGMGGAVGVRAMQVS
jgi:hypothetical protein